MSSTWVFGSESNLDECEFCRHARISRTNIEIDLSPRAAADRFSRHSLVAVRPYKPIEIVSEPVGVLRDPKHTLTQRDALHGIAAAFALAVDHLFVGQHGPQAGHQFTSASA